MVRPENLKLLEDNLMETFRTLERAKVFGSDHKSIGNKSKNRLIDLLKLKTFQTEKETVKHITEWEKIFAIYTSNKKLTPILTQRNHTPNNSI